MAKGKLSPEQFLIFYKIHENGYKVNIKNKDWLRTCGSLTQK